MFVAELTFATEEWPVQIPLRGTTRGWAGVLPVGCVEEEETERDREGHGPQHMTTATTAPQDARRVQFNLPPGHREHPPPPIRRDNVWRKLSNSTAVQLKGDGIARNPVQVVDNRPEHRRGEPHPRLLAQQQAQTGDALFHQPPALTANPTTSSSSSNGSAPQPQGYVEHSHGLADLQQQADQAVAAGMVPRWQILDVSHTMRSSTRTGGNIQDLSWLAGSMPSTYHLSFR